MRLPAATLLACFVVLSGCSDVGSGPDKNGGIRRVSTLPVSIVDITNAKLLMIQHAGAMARTAADSSGPSPVARLYKLTGDNVYEEVRSVRIDTLFLPDSDSLVLDTVEVVAVFEPQWVQNAGSDYVLASFLKADRDRSLPPGAEDEDVFLVRKSDGAVFATNLYQVGAHHVSPNLEAFNLGYGAVQTDSAGDIYCRDPSGVHRIGVGVSAGPTFQTLLTGASEFIVNGAGHFLYFTPQGAMLRFAGSGRLQFLHPPAPPVGLPGPGPGIWKGFNDRFYYTLGVQDSNMQNLQAIREITFVNDSAHAANIDTLPPGGAVGGTRFDMPAIHRIVFIGETVTAEVYNEEMKARFFQTSNLGITNIFLYAASDRHYYLAGLQAGQPVLRKVDPSVFPHAATSLTTPGAYTFRRLLVSRGGEVTFEATRMADGVDVLGEISPEGTLVIRRENPQEILQLVRVQ